MSTCPTCLDLYPRFDTKRWEHVDFDIIMESGKICPYSLKFDTASLEMTAKSGCPICCIILTGLKAMDNITCTFSRENAEQGRIIVRKCLPLQIEMLTSQGDKSGMIELYTSGIHSNETAQWMVNIGRANEIPPAISLERSTSIIAGWLRECDESHPQCSRQHLSLDRLPTRLLEIRPRLGHRLSLKLVDTCTLSKVPSRYVTLSHCWGKVHLIQTTSASIDTHKHGIEWHLLPKTFQEAIAITQALMIDFIWIDSLCIIQDDRQDWEKEAALMASVYSSGHLNIAATSAGDSCGGCLQPRTGTRSSPNIMDYPGTRSPNFETPAIYARNALEGTHLRYRSFSNHPGNPDEVEAVPLLSRAWIFQERHLAVRTVHFDPGEMVMECKSRLFCECSTMNGVRSITRGNLANLHLLKDKEVYEYWLDLIGDYSKLGLTKSSDRLPAILGVATVFHERLKSAYFAGIWEPDLARGLLWQVTRYGSHKGRSKHVRPTPPVAPSWSWASVVLYPEGSGVFFPAANDDSFKIDQLFKNESIGRCSFDEDLEVTHCVKIDLILESRATTGVFTFRCTDTDASSTVICATLLEEGDFVLLFAIDIDLNEDWGRLSGRGAFDGMTVHLLLIGSSGEEDHEDLAAKRDSLENSDDDIQGHYLGFLYILAVREMRGVADRFERVGIGYISEQKNFLLDSTVDRFHII